MGDVGIKLKSRKSLLIVSVLGLLIVSAFGYNWVQMKAGQAELPISWSTDWQATVKLSQETKKPIIAMFSSKWCGPCQSMKKTVLTQASVLQALAGWIPVYIDEKQYPSLCKQYKVHGYPTFLIIEAQGNELTRISGEMDTDAFIRLLNR